MPDASGDTARSVLRILHLEDNPSDAKLVKAILQSQGIACELTRAETRQEFLTALEQERLDLIISDFTLPSFDGLSALRLSRQMKPDLPFLFLSGTMGEAIAVESLKEGATDYILKDQMSRLGASVRRAVQEARSAVERRRMAEKLRQSNELFHWITENVDDLIAVLDVDGRRLFNSPSYGRIFGDPAALQGTESFAEVHPEDRERIREAFRRTVETGTGQRAEFRLLARDGTIRSIESQSNVVRNQDGRVVNVVVVSRDITERKSAEEKIRAQSILLNQARDAICATDMEQRIVYWNSGAERLYGWRAEQALGQKVNDLLFRDGLSRPLEALKQLIRQNEWQGELHKVTKDGNRIIVESRWTLLRDESGNPTTILVIDTDITEKKQIEAQLLRTQRMQSVGALAGGIAHDLNNVLAPILMVADLIRDELTSQEGREMLDTAKASAQRGAEMVKQILAFARGAGQEPKPVQVRHLVSEMVKLAGDTFPRSIQIQTSIAREPYPVLGDVTQLHQVLLNLCINARDAMPRGGTLRIEVDNTVLEGKRTPMQPDPLSGKFVVLAVSDTGCGIPPELLDKIFEPFFTTKEPGKGTGLGLSTVLGIVKAHRGTVEVTSEVSKGTSFKVYLPATTVVDTGFVRKELPAVQMGRDEMILLVDDEVAILEISRATLEAFNYRVLTASNGAEALTLYRQHSGEIAVVVTDMVMPVMDGVTLVRELRRIERGVKVVCVSGVGSRAKLPEMDQLHPDAFLTKPLSTETLLATVHQVIAAAGVPDAAKD